MPVITRATWYMARFRIPVEVTGPCQRCLWRDGTIYSTWAIPTCLQCTTQDQEEYADPHGLFSSNSVSIERNSETTDARCSIEDAVRRGCYSRGVWCTRRETKKLVETRLSQRRADDSYSVIS